MTSASLRPTKSCGSNCLGVGVGKDADDCRGLAGGTGGDGLTGCMSTGGGDSLGISSLPCSIITQLDNTPITKAAEASLGNRLARTSNSFEIRAMLFFKSGEICK
jgi:hypothetical protein